MSKLDVQTLEVLKNLGVQFIVWGPGPGGSHQYAATPEELLILEKDCEGFYAAVNGMSLEQYREWTQSGCSIICSATTKAGQRCTNYVKGGYQVGADEWLKRFGEACANHGG